MKDEAKEKDAAIGKSRISRAKTYVIRDSSRGKYILEVRLGRMSRRVSFVRREDAVSEGERILASGAVSEWINAKKPAPRMRTEWAKKHKRVSVASGWRGRVMIGGFSK